MLSPPRPDYPSMSRQAEQRARSKTASRRHPPFDRPEKWGHRGPTGQARLRNRQQTQQSRFDAELEGSRSSRTVGRRHADEVKRLAGDGMAGTSAPAGPVSRRSGHVLSRPCRFAGFARRNIRSGLEKTTLPLPLRSPATKERRCTKTSPSGWASADTAAVWHYTNQMPTCPRPAPFTEE